MMSTLIYTVVILAVFLLVPVIDQITKAMAMAATAGGSQAITVIPGVLRWKIVRNTGASMGLFADSAAGRVFFMVLSTVAILGIIAALLFFRKKLNFSDFSAITLALVAGGGIGNMIDRTFFGERLFQGAVIDFIDFCAFPSLWRWTFNFADACICVGVGLFIIGMIADEVREMKRKRARALSPDAARDEKTKEGDTDQNIPCDEEKRDD